MRRAAVFPTVVFPTALFAGLLLCLAACGKGDTPSSPTAGPGPATPPAAPEVATPEAASKATLLEIFALAPKGDVEAGASHVVYRGPDAARKWKDLSDVTKDVEKQYVRTVMGTIARLLEAGTPTFLEYTTETESEGTWHGWKVRFGEGDKSKSAMFGLLEVKGRFAIGDID